MALPRSALLPDLQSSRAVLVGNGPPGPEPAGRWGPREMARQLADALTTPDDGTAVLRAMYTRVLTDAAPAEVVDAVRTACAAATDTLVFYYAGDGPGHKRCVGAGTLRAVAELIGAARAARPVVVLDGVGGSVFKEFAPTSFVLAGSSFSFPPGDQLVPFTPTLVSGLRHGVVDGPEMLDLLTLRTAVEATFHEARYCFEDDWVGGASSLEMRHPHRYRMVALGLNRCFGATKPYGLPRDEAAVDEAYL